MSPMTAPTGRTEMSASKPKTPTASGISRLLATAGFERSELSTTRIRDYRRRTYGYIVQGCGPGEVTARHTSGQFAPSDEDRADSRRTEDSYAATIEAAGYTVRRDDYLSLIVTAKEG